MFDSLYRGSTEEHLPETPERDCREGLKEAYRSEQRPQYLADDLNVRGYPKAANTIEWFLLGLMNYTAFPNDHWKRIRTTNMIERVNRG